MNAFLSFPGILLAIAFVAFRGPGIFNLVLALSLGGWVGYARLVRAQVLATREREYVEAARALGASDWRVIVRHILPNIIQPIIVQAAIGMAGAILAESKWVCNPFSAEISEGSSLDFLSALPVLGGEK